MERRKMKMIKSGLTDVVVEANSNNYTEGRRGYKVCKITPHHMAGVLSAEACGRIFKMQIDKLVLIME